MNSLNKALDRLRDKVPLQPYLGHLSILDQGHSQKLSKIETLRLAQNYIQLLAIFLSSNQPFTIENLLAMLGQNLSQATINLLRSRLVYDLDYSVAKNLLIDCDDRVVDISDNYNRVRDNGPPNWTSEEERGYSDYLDSEQFYGFCK